MTFVASGGVKDLYEYVEELNKSDVDSYLKKILEIQFDPNYGSKHWLNIEKKIGFNVRENINSIDDLIILEEALEKLDRNKSEDEKEFSEEHLRKKGMIEHIVPKKYLKKGDIIVCPSSATKGATKFIPWDINTSNEIINFYEFYFKYSRFPENEKWLVIGPYGLYEIHLTEAALRLKGITIPIGIESWGAKQETDKNRIRERFEPTLGRIKDAFLAEKIGVIATATEMAEMLSHFVDTSEIKAVYLSGTGTNPERIKLLSQVYKSKIFGIGYGHCMWGPAFHIYDGTDNLNYYSHKLQCIYKIVDPQNPTVELKYGERGQVKAYILRPEFFWIIRERDSAIKIPGKGPFNWDGVRNVDKL